MLVKTTFITAYGREFDDPVEGITDEVQKRIQLHLEEYTGGSSLTTNIAAAIIVAYAKTYAEWVAVVDEVKEKKEAGFSVESFGINSGGIHGGN